MDEQRTEELLEEEIQMEEGPAERDYGSEVHELYEARPELRGEQLPDAVVQACIRGQKLTDAYNQFAKSRHQEAENLRKENRILRENAKAAAKAPVRGLSRGSSVSNKPEDPFLRGFNESW